MSIDNGTQNNRVALLNKLFNSIIMLFLLLVLTGCGLTQSIKESSSELAEKLFYKRVKVLRLDIVPRSDINLDDNQQALSIVLRVYQLKDRQMFDQLDYTTLLKSDSELLQQDLLARRELSLRPNANASITQQMEDETRYVAIAGFFRNPDLVQNDWRLVIERSDLDNDRATQIEVNSTSLGLIK